MANFNLNAVLDPAGLDAQCSTTFRYFAEVTYKGKGPAEKYNNEISNMGLVDMFKECCGKSVASHGESEVFPILCDRNRRLSLDVFLGTYITMLAAVIVKKEKDLKKNPPLGDAYVKAKAFELKHKIAALSELREKAKVEKTKEDKVPGRLTGKGTEKERFRHEEKGRGYDSGYVGKTGNKNTRE